MADPNPQTIISKLSSATEHFTLILAIISFLYDLQLWPSLLLTLLKDAAEFSDILW